MTDSALIIFLRKAELGMVKTRLAKSIGDEKALKTYEILSEKTFQVCQIPALDIFPFFKPEIPNDILWNKKNARIQKGNGLGECMFNAFHHLFDKDYKKVLIIGSDCYSLRKDILQKAYEELNTHDFVLGPSEDGGYYLLGMKELTSDLFSEIEWSKETVFQNTIDKIANRSVFILETLNDIDTLEDLEKEPDLYNQVI